MKLLFLSMVILPMTAAAQADPTDPGLFSFVFILFGIGLLALYYFVIREAVRSASRKQIELLEKQNTILMMLLNQAGVDRDTLQDIFVTGKKDPWMALKNYSNGVEQKTPTSKSVGVS
jgi:hypothetical protein